MRLREQEAADINKTVTIPSTDATDPDIVFDKKSFSQFIIGLNELEIIEVNDIDAAVAGECLIDIFVNIDPDFDEEDRTLKSVDLVYYTRDRQQWVRRPETYTDIPDAIGRIPGFDIEQLLYEGWWLDDWIIRVKLTYQTQGGWYDEDEEHYTQYPDLVNVTIKEMYIQTGRDISQYFVQDLLNDEARRIILNICEDYMTDNIEQIVD